MKQITFDTLRLINFCGIRDAKLCFNGQSVIISGKNGIGKSTAAKAISYVLFGTDLRGNTFEIKTYDSEHRIIPEIEHSAELRMHVDDEPVTLKRTLTDSWNKDSVKNSYKYFVNDENTSAGDFKKYVEGICPEVVFRLASSPIFFLSKNWQEQRKFLETLTTAPSADAITGGDAKYDFVVEALKKESIDKLVSHLKYKRNEVQKLLDSMPTKLSTLKQTLPEKQDWDALRLEKEAIEKEHANIQQKLFDAKNGNANSIVKDGIKKRIELAEKRIREMEKSARVMAGEAEVKHSSDLINARTAHQKASSVVSELQAKMGGFTDTEVHINQQIDDAKASVKALNDKQTKIFSMVWTWDDENNYCPHCGQLLPVGKVTQLKEESEKRFREKKASDIKKLQEQFMAIQGEYTDANKLLEQLNEERKVTTNQLVEANKALKEAEKHLADVKDDEPKGYSVLLAENPNYREVVNELDALNKQLESPVEGDEDTKELIASLESQLSAIQARAKENYQKAKDEDAYIKVSNLIKEALDSKKTYQEQIDDLNNQIDIAAEYYEKSCSILEEEVNKHFSFVKWSMFKSNLNGEKLPFCECYHDGVPYSSLNTSAKINAGIDIANTIARYYQVSVPIILDNCESNLHPLYSLGQQIRLSVTPNVELVVKQLDQADYAG